MQKIEPGYHVFLEGDEEECGAVREVRRDKLVVNIENGGEFFVPLDAVADVVEQKVFLRVSRLDDRIKDAARHAHQLEDFPNP